MSDELIENTNTEINPDTPKKTCSKCKLEKPLTDYRKNPSCKDGLQVQCKNCLNEHNKNYYLKNKEEIIKKVIRARRKRRKLEKLKINQNQENTENNNPPENIVNLPISQ